jgi:hypothetical protein
MPSHPAPVVWERDEGSLSDDETVVKQARHVLDARGYSALSALEFDVRAGILELRGIVSSYYLKQLAQASVLRLKAVREVKNSIEVIGMATIAVREGGRGDPTAGTDRVVDNSTSWEK